MCVIITARTPLQEILHPPLLRQAYVSQKIQIFTTYSNQMQEHKDGIRVYPCTALHCGKCQCEGNTTHTYMYA